MRKYFYTFGTDERFPFSGGWITIEAPDVTTAHAVFRALYPDRTPGVLNCADYYPEAVFMETGMFKGNRGAGCHRYVTYGEALHILPHIEITIDGRKINALPQTWRQAPGIYHQRPPRRGRQVRRAPWEKENTPSG